MTWSGKAFNIPPKTVERHFRKNYGLDGPIALILLDMDLYEPTIAALRWSQSRIQSGTIIFADEYFAFGGRTDRGEALEIKEFLQENPEIPLSHFGFYGAGGAVFIVSANSN